MEITPNRRMYIRERLDTGLGQTGVPLCDHSDIIAACFTAIKEMPEGRIHDDIFDFEKRIDEIARKENLPPQEVRQTILAQPKILLGLQEFVSVEAPVAAAASPANIPERNRIIPSDEEIAIAALKIKKSTGKYPTGASKHEELPEGSLGWTMIIKALPERGLAIKTIVDTFKSEAIKAMPVPDDLFLAEAALKIKFLTKALPNKGSKRMQLPDTAPDWDVILSNLKERGTTITRIVKECYPRALRDSETFNKKRKISTLLFMPSDQVVADAALRYKNDNGKLPNSWGKKIGLPELSVPWPAIIRSLQQRGTTIAAIAQEFYPESFQRVAIVKEKKPRSEKVMPANQQLADAALKVKTETGRLPHMSSKKSELPDNSYPWSAILPKLTERGTSIGAIVREYHPSAFINTASTAKPKADRIKRTPANGKMPRNFIPDHEMIADSAINVREVTGYLPNPKNRKDGLPKGSAEWGVIIPALQAQGFTLIGVVTKYYPGVLQQVTAAPVNGQALARSFSQPAAKARPVDTPPKDVLPVQKPASAPLAGSFAPSVVRPQAVPPPPAPAREKTKAPVAIVQPVAVQLKVMPPLDVIAQAAWMYQNTHGRKPDMRSGAEFLPEDSHAWPALILAHLKGDNVLRNLMERYPDNARRTVHFNGTANPHRVNGHTEHPADGPAHRGAERRERFQTRQP